MELTNLRQQLGLVNLKLQKHSPEILLGVGIFGMIAAGVAGAYATLKVDAVKEEMNETLERIEEAERVGENEAGDGYTKSDAEHDRKVTYIQTGLQYAKLYAPAIGLGVLSIAALVGSHGIMERRQVSLAAAYNLVLNGWQAYRERVVEELGLEKDQQFYLGLKEEEYTEKELQEDGTTKKVKKTKMVKVADPKMYQRLFDSSNRNWQMTGELNESWLIGQQRWLNDKLTNRGYLFLNEVYEDLGFEPVPEGQLVGWFIKKTTEEMNAEKRDGYITFRLDNAYNESSRQQNIAWLLDFNPDGRVFDLL